VKRGVFDYTPQEMERGGMEAVLRCPVGWSGDHRVVCRLFLPPFLAHCLSLYLLYPLFSFCVPLSTVFRIERERGVVPTFESGVGAWR